jgi:probable F420-dependent oxidoreductase
MPKLTQPAQRWRDALRRIEELGFSTVAVSDHFTNGWAMEPTVVMMAAAAATENLRVLSLVFGNDYRHPVLLHKAVATIDVLSRGRVELGIGTGWLLSDYESAHLRYDPPGVRLARLRESVLIIKGLFEPSPLTFEGDHYRISALEGLPSPVQQPHPPVMIGGGGRRVLTFAGQTADIVGINPNLRAGVTGSTTVMDMSAERIAGKIEWVRSAAQAAGRALGDVELQMSMLMCRVTGSKTKVQASISSMARTSAADPAFIERCPAVLAGSVEQCVESLQRLREQYGISYIHLGPGVETVAPIVKRLAGR